MKSFDWMDALVFFVIGSTFGFIFGMLAGVSSSNVKFEGACDYLKGEVQDAVCVKDGRVVLDSRLEK